MTMSAAEEDLMQQHLRDENLPEAVMPAPPINKVLIYGPFRESC